MKAFILTGKTPYKNMSEKLDDDFHFITHRKKYFAMCFVVCWRV